MKIKETILALLLSATILCSCGKKGEEEPGTLASVDPNIPANTVAPETEEIFGSEIGTPTEAVVTEPDETLPETAAQPETEPETEVITENTTEEPEETEPETSYAEEPEPDGLLDTRAMECLRLINSDRLHLKFVAADSYDGEQIYTTSAEYYVDGSNKVYIVNSIKRIIRGTEITVIDNDNAFYMTYEDPAGYTLHFGYALSDYKLTSETETEEVYEIEGEDVTSTWSFDGDGIKIADRRADGSFTLYDIEILSDDLTGIDYSVPVGYDEVNADDYEMYK